MPAIRRPAGFTLIELIVTISVVSILVAIGVPGLSQFNHNSRAADAASGLLASLTLARNEALTRGAPVAICASSNLLTCSNQLDWSRGWIIFTDSSGVATQRDGSDTLLRTSGALKGQDRLSATQAAVRFLNTGFVQGNASTQFEYRIPHCRGSTNRDISLSPQGRTSVTTAVCT